MGVKTEISKKDISSYFDIKSLKPTSNGVSHTVYIVNDSYILKLYEDVEDFYVDEEIKLLNLCSQLNIAKVEKQLFIKNKRALVFKKSKGEILDEVKFIHLNQIALFLKDLHKQTKNKKHKNKDMFSKKSLENLIEKSKNDFFKTEFENIDIKLKNDGIIHGDLFLDNAIFYENKLTCVFDFSDACEGDFVFDLAVIALSWCNNKAQVLELVNTYDKSIKLDDFIKYMRYASLFYCVSRYLDNRDYGNILFKNKFKDLIG